MYEVYEFSFQLPGWAILTILGAIFLSMVLSFVAAVLQWKLGKLEREGKQIDKEIELMRSVQG